MKLESVTCNHCGAPLKVPEGANYVTCTHCERQLVVRRTEGVRFTETLEDLHEQVEKLTRQNEIAALDREWEQQKEQYLVIGKHGHKQLPTKTGSVIGGIVIAVFGSIWTVLACGIGGAAGGDFELVGVLFPLFGVCFVVAGIGFSIHAYNKAHRYTRAQEEYQRRRRELLEKTSEP